MCVSCAHRKLRASERDAMWLTVNSFLHEEVIRMSNTSIKRPTPSRVSLNKGIISLTFCLLKCAYKHTLFNVFDCLGFYVDGSPCKVIIACFLFTCSRKLIPFVFLCFPFEDRAPWRAPTYVRRHSRVLDSSRIM